MMKTSDQRRFGLFDVMILVAAIAFGLGLSQLGWPRDGDSSGFIITPLTLTVTSVSVNGVITRPLRNPLAHYPSHALVLPVGQQVAPYVPCLWMLSAAVLLLRFRSPRPRRRRIMIQPGTVAALAVVAAVLIELPLILATDFVDNRFVFAPSIGSTNYVGNLVVMMSHRAGLAVGLAWLFQIMIGRWRPEKSWVDRAGRLIGAAWMIVGAAAGIIESHSAWWGVLLRY